MIGISVSPCFRLNETALWMEATSNWFIFSSQLLMNCYWKMLQNVWLLCLCSDSYVYLCYVMVCDTLISQGLHLASFAIQIWNSIMNWTLPVIPLLLCNRVCCFSLRWQLVSSEYELAALPECNHEWRMK